MMNMKRKLLLNGITQVKDKITNILTKKNYIQYLVLANWPKVRIHLHFNLTKELSYM